MMSGEVSDNRARHRFELEVEGGRAVAMYELDGDTITFTHTVVPRPARGGGAGRRLVQAALDSAREQGLRVVPRCPFVSRFIQRHPEYAELTR